MTDPEETARAQDPTDAVGAGTSEEPTPDVQPDLQPTEPTRYADRTDSAVDEAPAEPAATEDRTGTPTDIDPTAASDVPDEPATVATAGEPADPTTGETAAEPANETAETATGESAPTAPDGGGDGAAEVPAYPSESEEVARGRHRKDRGVRRVRASVKVTAAAVVLALLGVAIWTGVDVRDQRDSDKLDDSALAAGRSAAALFTSYDYRHLSTSLNALANEATGTFKTQFSAAIQTLSTAITEAKGVSVGTVQSAGLRERNRDTAVVLAAVDASITNTSATTAVTRRYRIEVTLTRTDGKWLISDIESVG